MGRVFKPSRRVQMFVVLQDVIHPITTRIDWAAVDFPAVILALMFLTDSRLDFYENTPDAKAFYDLIDNMNEDTMWVHIAECEENTQ
jgi:hypothetical protein